MRKAEEAMTKKQDRKEGKAGEESGKGLWEEEARKWKVQLSQSTEWDKKNRKHLEDNMSPTVFLSENKKEIRSAKPIC